MIQGLGCQFRTCKISASHFSRLLLRANSFDTNSETFLKPHLTQSSDTSGYNLSVTGPRFHSTQIAGKSMYMRESPGQTTDGFQGIIRWGNTS